MNEFDSLPTQDWVVIGIAGVVIAAGILAVIVPERKSGTPSGGGWFFTGLALAAMISFGIAWLYANVKYR